jgi:predicted polyphosphate/ATP-dependent NAD kinase
VDLVQHNTLIASDVTEEQLWEKIIQAQKNKQSVHLIITLIGGQGHLFGRGNQQISPRIIRTIIEQTGGKENITIIATKAKLTALDNRALVSDTGDNALDQNLSGFMPVTTGYRDQVLYPIASPM